MPYKSNADLPQGVKTALPAAAQTIFRNAFNAMMAKTPDLSEARMFKQAWGANLPRTAEEISQVGASVESHDLQPGDLVFYNTLRRGFSHVGIYLGDNKFIHSPSAGGQVRIESMEIGYWKSRFNGARRISDPEGK